MNTDIEKIEKRTIRYWFEDGVHEMASGLFFMIMGLFFLGSALAPGKSTARFIFDIGLMPVILFGGWGVKKTSQYMKQKLTYSRTGYVAYRKPEGVKRLRQALLATGCAGVLGALAVLLPSARSGGFDWVPAVSGFAFAVALGFVSFRFGLTRVAVAAFLMAAAGIILAFSGWGEARELAAFYGFVGVSMILSGVVGCRRYLKRNPLPDEGSR